MGDWRFLNNQSKLNEFKAFLLWTLGALQKWSYLSAQLQAEHLRYNWSVCWSVIVDVSQFVNRARHRKRQLIGCPATSLSAPVQSLCCVCMLCKWVAGVWREEIKSDALPSVALSSKQRSAGSAGSGKWSRIYSSFFRLFRLRVHSADWPLATHTHVKNCVLIK